MNMTSPPRSIAGLSRRTTKAGTVAIVAAVTLGLAPESSRSAQDPEQLATSPASSRPFSSTSPFNVPIVDDPAVDPSSGAMISRATRTGMVHANLFEYGIPIYSATALTPRHPVDCAGPSSWGTCPFWVQAMPIPSGAAPNQGSDGVMTVMDLSTNTVSEYWQARQTPDGEWTTTWGAENSMSGSGWGGSSTGAGASRIGGVVRVDEIEAGVIDHALVMQSDNVCKDVYRAPALKTDGNSSRSDCIPEGARLQLSPGIDVEGIPGITTGEVAVAKALQTHGAYLIDRADTSLSISFELAPDATPASPGRVYEEAGFAWDYYGMPKVPWKEMRVLESWNG
ncbi:hypothetical protein [Kocuria sp. CPCC 205263]|uniref:hypothetical protein n=1 Tax=Kocuria sp. CPCC 205263 TaxID=3073555 RepID=UPI0034D7B080